MISITGSKTSALIMTDVVEQSALIQIKTICDNEAYANCKIVIMPDVHAGAGDAVIGFTSQYNHKIDPRVIGVDIGCGVLSARIPAQFTEFVESHLPQINDLILKTIPTGFNLHQDRADVRTMKQALMQKYSKDYEYLKKICDKVGTNITHLHHSLGTLGGGNHFIEIGKSDKDGSLWLTIHTGSRNFGHRVCQYHTGIMNTGGHTKDDLSRMLNDDIVAFKDHNSNGKDIADYVMQRKMYYRQSQPTPYLYGNALLDYIRDMVYAQTYAALNRLSILSLINTAFVFDLNLSKDFDFVDLVESVHNYIDFDSEIIRKGAISAEAGKNVVIPFNMRDGLIFGVGMGNREWNYSAPHGAGRALSRSEAFNSLKLSDFQDSMSGVYSTCVTQSTLDESPMAYKDYRSIIEGIRETVYVKELVKPILNIKSTQDGTEYKWAKK